MSAKWSWKDATGEEEEGEDAAEPPTYDRAGEGSHGPTFSLKAEELQDPSIIFDKPFSVSLRKTIVLQTNLYRSQQAAQGSTTLVDAITKTPRSTSTSS